MNKVIMMGRLTRDPEVRYGGANNNAVARYSLAVDRRFKRDGEPDADFFNCVAFGKTAEFVEKYLHKGTKVVVEGEVRNNNYTNKDGQKVYGTDILTNQIEFAESKATASATSNGEQTATSATPTAPTGTDDGGFMNIPDGIEDELPFN